MYTLQSLQRRGEQRGTQRAPTLYSLDLEGKGMNMQQISIYSFLGTQSDLEKDHWSWNQKTCASALGILNHWVTFDKSLNVTVP